MSNVPAGTVAGDENPSEVSVIREPWFVAAAFFGDRRGVRSDPLESRPAIVVSGWKKVFGSEAVFDRDGDAVG
jgi:hypothetical protein